MCIECMANPKTKAPAGRHISEILADPTDARITRKKANNVLEDILTQLGLNGEGS